LDEIAAQILTQLRGIKRIKSSCDGGMANCSRGHRFPPLTNRDTKDWV
jgi:hypothetical protein